MAFTVEGELGGGHFDMSLLNIDEAYLNITTDSVFYLYKLVDECYKCPFSFLAEVNQSQVLKVSTKYGTSWRLYQNRTSDTFREHDKDDLICELRPRNFGEFGIYHIIKSDQNCSILTNKSPPHLFYLPLYSITLLLIIIGIIWNVAATKITFFHSKEASPKTNDKRNKRLISLDTFRGICIVLMIFVNDGAGQYSSLIHANWNGLHLADVVFPWFLWIMGACIPISVKSQLKKKVSRCRIFISILRRSLILFLLGLLISSIDVGPQLETLRIFGVLQRFSISYFVVATLMTFLTFQLKRKGPFTDMLNISVLWILMILIVAGHLYLIFYYPVPGCPIGYLGPGGLHYNGIYQNCVGGFTGYIDKLILGEKHIFQNPTSNFIYRSGPFDPEGLFGCLLTIFQVFLGVQAGIIILTFPDWKQRIKRWIVWGVVAAIFGLILCQARQEGGWIPLNKNLWSLSYVLVTSGMAFLLLSFLYYIIDHVKCWSGSPFFYPGMNAILIFVGQEIGYDLFPWHWRYGNMNTHLIATIEAVWGTLLWIFISYMLFKNKFFLSL